MPPDDPYQRAYTHTIEDAARACVNGQKLEVIKCLAVVTAHNIRIMLDEEGVAYANGATTADYWERMSEHLWMLHSDLVACSDTRAESIKWLAEQFDEIWGVS